MRMRSFPYGLSPARRGVAHPRRVLVAEGRGRRRQKFAYPSFGLSGGWSAAPPFSPSCAANSAGWQRRMNPHSSSRQRAGATLGQAPVRPCWLLSPSTRPGLRHARPGYKCHPRGQWWRGSRRQGRRYRCFAEPVSGSSVLHRDRLSSTGCDLEVDTFTGRRVVAVLNLLVAMRGNLQTGGARGSGASSAVDRHSTR